MTAATALIQAKDLCFGYGDGFELRVADLTVRPGQVLLLRGPSGCGKTTLLRLLAGLLTPAAGSVRVLEKDLAQLSVSASRALRLREMGLVFQDFALIDYLTAEENVALPAKFAGGAAPDPAYLQRLQEELDLTPLWQRRVTRLSQGEQQRVAIARALSGRPRCVLADEPTASLDPRRRDRVVDLLKNYAVSEQAAVVLVTHAPALWQGFSEVLDLGDEEVAAP